ncbi:hypothetical protein RB200_32455 [Streptomyces sp. PmtG]
MRVLVEEDVPLPHGAVQELQGHAVGEGPGPYVHRRRQQELVAGHGVAEVVRVGLEEVVLTGVRHLPGQGPERVRVVQRHTDVDALARAPLDGLEAASPQPVTLPQQLGGEEHFGDEGRAGPFVAGRAVPPGGVAGQPRHGQAEPPVQRRQGRLLVEYVHGGAPGRGRRQVPRRAGREVQDRLVPPLLGDLRGVGLDEQPPHAHDPFEPQQQHAHRLVQGVDADDARGVRAQPVDGRAEDPGPPLARTVGQLQEGVAEVEVVAVGDRDGRAARRRLPPGRGPADEQVAVVRQAHRAGLQDRRPVLGRLPGGEALHGPLEHALAHRRGVRDDAGPVAMGAGRAQLLPRGGIGLGPAQAEQTAADARHLVLRKALGADVEPRPRHDPPVRQRDLPALLDRAGLPTLHRRHQQPPDVSPASRHRL